MTKNIIGHPSLDWRYHNRLKRIGKYAERKIRDAFDDKPTGKVLGKLVRVMIENSEPQE